jgi:hypothetical protein
MMNSINISKIIHRLLTISYISVVFFGLLLPSGSIFKINIKYVLFIILVILLFTYLFIENIHVKYSFISSLSFTIAFLLIWSLIFIINGFDDYLSLSGELKDFIVTILLVYISYVIILKNIIDIDIIVKTIIYAMLLLIMLHIILVALMIIFGLSFESTFGVIKEIFNVYIMTFDISDQFKRAQLPNDIIIPFGLYIVLFSKELNIKLSPIIKYLFIMASLIVLFLTFSRFIWIVTLIFIITSLIYKRRYIVLILLPMLVVYLLSFQAKDMFTAGIIQARFFSEAAESSDNTRAAQFESLMTTFYNHYLIGNGIGSYARDCIRSDRFPFSYEMQWIAFLMKFGLIGMGILLFHILGFLRICLIKMHKHRGYLLIGITLYFLGGFTNPYLLTSYAGCFYILFMALCFKNSPEEQNDSIIQISQNHCANGWVNL